VIPIIPVISIVGLQGNTFIEQILLPRWRDRPPSAIPDRDDRV